MNAPVRISASEFVDTDQAIQFLRLVHPTGPWVLWANAADGRGPWCSEAFYPGDEDRVKAWIEGHARHNQYYHVNPYPKVRRSERGALLKANKTDITEVRYLHVDVDPSPPPVGASEEEKARHVGAERDRIVPLLMDAEPTCIVDSGGGFQALFRLDVPVPLDGSVEMADEFARRNHGLAVRLGGDVSAKDVSRVLRLPGTTNWPDKRKIEKGRGVAPAKMLWHEPTTFPLSYFPAAEREKASPGHQGARQATERTVDSNTGEPATTAPAKPASGADVGELLARLPTDLSAIIRAGSDERNPGRWTSRSEAVFFAACSLVRAGCSDEDIANVLTNSDYGIGAHVRDQSNPHEYALRQARSAREDVDSGPLVLSREHPMSSAGHFIRLRRPHLMHTNGEWLDFNGCAYQAVEEETIKAELYRLMVAAVEISAKGEPRSFPATKARVADVIDALQANAHREKDRYRPPCWLRGDGPPAGEILACANGLVHLPSGTLLPPTPDFYTRNALGFAYDPDAPAPARWLALLEEYWPNSPGSIDLLLEMMGYLLVPDTSLHKILLFMGPPRSGKSTIAQVIGHLVGQENTCGPNASSLSHPFGLEPLIGKQLAILGDMRIGSKTDQAAIAENLLRVSGGDMVSVNRKYKLAWSGRLPTRFLILSNELPHLADASTALANRYLPLVFTKSYLGREDPDLLPQLLAELPGILNWAIEGWRRLKARGRFELPPESKEVLGSLIDLGSPVTAFVEELCELDPSASTAKHELYQAWHSYCEARGLHPGTIDTFGKDLMAAYPGRKIRPSKERRGGGRVNVYLGIRLQGAFEPDAPF
ncbi:phage/plasmid primase, P4 family [Mesorhizobium sp. M7A.F.Ce.TU.012.03.2.1]|uniref:phage/plasmid primase, P4 family n=1 Tax=Mesorhizobium sp. M7A.F.Ce.TU.012.03.2.1 TaxID=2493681 RepID=UPI0013E36203|nr:phage/plasmid primase, P4 family [Mesorhizobium sp. M7A.F.Ce.TU.012.03.2.1]